MSSYTISQILLTRKITDYLSARNIIPDSDNGGKWWYSCPLHEEDTPSFAVFDAEPQNFFCWGCKAGGNIINLKMMLEKVGGRQAIEALSEGLNITIDDEYKYFVAQIDKQADSVFTYNPEELSLAISQTVGTFLDSIKFEEPYFSSFERLFQKVDTLLESGDMTTVTDIYEKYLDDIISQQFDQYELQKEAEFRDSYSPYNKIGST